MTERVETAGRVYQQRISRKEAPPQQGSRERSLTVTQVFLISVCVVFSLTALQQHSRSLLSFVRTMQRKENPRRKQRTREQGSTQQQTRGLMGMGGPSAVRRRLLPKSEKTHEQV